MAAVGVRFLFLFHPFSGGGLTVIRSQKLVIHFPNEYKQKDVFDKIIKQKLRFIVMNHGDLFTNLIS